MAGVLLHLHASTASTAAAPLPEPVQCYETTAAYGSMHALLHSMACFPGAAQPDLARQPKPCVENWCVHALVVPISTANRCGQDQAKY